MSAPLDLLEADSDRLLVAVTRLLTEKGILSHADIAEQIASSDAANPALGLRWWPAPGPIRCIAR